MNPLSFVSDTYERDARLIPTLIVLASPIFIATVLATEEVKLLNSLLLVGVISGVILLLKSVVRERGRNLEKSLWQEWGGMPSMQRLRFSDDTFDVEDTTAFHQILRDLAPHIHLPSSASELENPDQADQAYRRASTWILDNTRDIKKFPLVFKENVSYGFRRNLLAARNIGLVLNAATFVSLCAFVYISSSNASSLQEILSRVTTREWLCVTWLSIHSLMLATIVRRDWVQAAANAFSVQLIRSLNSLKRAQ